MQKLFEIEALLQKIRGNYSMQRTDLVRMLQNKILEKPDLPDEEQQEYFSELVYNLNFYDREETDASLGYYGDHHLSELILGAIQKVKGFLKQ